MSDTGPGSARRRLATALTAILGVITLAVAGYAVFLDKPHVASAGSIIGYVPAPPVTRKQVTAYVMGDSVTAGTASDYPGSYANFIGPMLSWDVTVDGVGGSGFIALGFGGVKNPQPFSVRLPALIAANPDYVIIAGGRNDWGDTSVIAPVIDGFFTRLRAGLPNAKIIALSVWHWDRPKDQAELPHVQQLNGIIQDAVNRVQGRFIDMEPLHLITSANEPITVGSDHFHPTHQGHMWIAQQLARDLVSLGYPRGPQEWRHAGVDGWVDATDAYFDGAGIIKDTVSGQ